jgi:hypothetical protein
MHISEPRVRSLILEELFERSEPTRLDPPEIGRIQLDFVMLLINPTMTSFDFSVCGAMKFDGDEEMWQCLLANAPFLTTIKDGRRVEKNPVDSLSSRSLQFLVQFKNLEELKVLSYFCSDGNFFSIYIYCSLFI